MRHVKILRKLLKSPSDSRYDIKYHSSIKLRHDLISKCNKSTSVNFYHELIAFHYAMYTVEFLFHMVEIHVHTNIVPLGLETVQNNIDTCIESLSRIRYGNF